MTFPRRAAAALLALGLSASLAACGDDSESRDKALVEGTWALTEFDAADIDADPTVASVITLDGGKVTGNGGVNTITGTYDAQEDGKISFGALATTKMAGPENAAAQEKRFLAELEKVENFEYDKEDKELDLKDGKDKTLLTLVATSGS